MEFSSVLTSASVVWGLQENPAVPHRGLTQASFYLSVLLPHLQLLPIGCQHQLLTLNADFSLSSQKKKYIAEI